MDFLTKQKAFISIIIVLVMLNVTTLVFWWLGNLNKSLPGLPHPRNMNEFLSK